MLGDLVSSWLRQWQQQCHYSDNHHALLHGDELQQQQYWSETGSSLRLLIFSYIAGVSTMAVLGLLRRWFTQNIPDNLNFRDDDTMSWIDPWNVPSNLLSRIGETITFRGRPRRQHWPWETIRQRLSFVKVDNDSREENASDGDDVGGLNNASTRPPSTTTTKGRHSTKDGLFNGKIDASKRESPVGRHNKSSQAALDEYQRLDRDSESDVAADGDDDISTIASSVGDSEDGPKLSTVDKTNDSIKLKKEKSLCIGSIFGLDVGGTLAKLVYFEQKPLELDPVQGSVRERNYTQAASVQAVIHARMAAERTLFVSDPHLKTYEDSMEQHPFDSTKSPKSGQVSSKPTTSSPHYLQRRRSLSVGFMNRQKDIHKERLAEQQREKETQSEKDLAQLYTLRQESLPDDVRHFRHSVDFHDINDEGMRRMFNDKILETKSDDGDYVDDGADDVTRPRRSISMFDLSSHSKMQQKAEALNRFYNFARRLDAEESLRDHKLSFYSRELGGEFHFVRFETRHMQNAMDLIRYNNLHLHICDVGATGGGAHKFADAWEEQLGIRIDKQEELDSQVAGMQFVLSTVIGECYTFRPVQRSGLQSRTSSSSTAEANNVSVDSFPSEPKVGLGLSEDISESDLHDRVRMDVDHESGVGEGLGNAGTDSSNKVDDWWWSRKVQRDAISYSSAYPYLVVTIGTGVSIMRVDGPRKHERISGSTIGGGTYWGLMRLLTDVETFEDAMKRAEMGDPCKVDMMVGDIYGKNSTALEKLGLPSHVVASSFGKLVAKEFPAEGLTQEDLARALLLMVTNNIGLVAYLNAKTVKTSRIYFVGSFLSQNMISQRRLSFAIDFWSKGTMEALFLEHEGYFGALGAFLLSQNIVEHEEGFGFRWDSNPNNVVQGDRYRSGKSNTFRDRKQHTFGG